MTISVNAKEGGGWGLFSVRTIYTYVFFSSSPATKKSLLFQQVFQKRPYTPTAHPQFYILLFLLLLIFKR